MVISCKIYFTETSRITLHQLSGYCGLQKLTYKTNHHKGGKWTLGNVFEGYTRAEYEPLILRLGLQSIEMHTHDSRRACTECSQQPNKLSPPQEPVKSASDKCVEAQAHHGILDGNTRQHGHISAVRQGASWARRQRTPALLLRRRRLLLHLFKIQNWPHESLLLEVSAVRAATGNGALGGLECR